MASRSTSSSHRHTSASHQQTQQARQRPASSASATTSTANKHNLFSQSHTRRPPSSVSTHHTTQDRAASRTHAPRVHEPRRARPTYDGPDEEDEDPTAGLEEDEESDDDILISRPSDGAAAGFTGDVFQDPDVSPRKEVDWDDPNHPRYFDFGPQPEAANNNATANAQAHASALELLAAYQAGHQGFGQYATVGGKVDQAAFAAAPNLETEDAGFDVVESDESARLIAMYRARERDREQVDQEELKRVLWESLRRKVKSLDDDRWMYEVEDTTGVES